MGEWFQGLFDIVVYFVCGCVFVASVVGASVVISIVLHKIGRKLHSRVIFKKKTTDFIRGYQKRLNCTQLAHIVEVLHLKGLTYTGNGGCPGAAWLRKQLDHHDRPQMFVLRELEMPNHIETKQSVDWGWGGGMLDLRKKVKTLNWCVVGRYSEMKTPFPPIVLDSTGYVVEGVHRLYAAKRRGDKTILAYVPTWAKKIKLSA